MSMGFPDSSVGKGSACNAQDPALIPGLGRSPGEGIGYPLQYSWASLLAQLVKNPPAMQETWVQSLGWEDPLGKGEATRSSILAWRIPWTEEPGGLQSMGLWRVGHNWVTEHTHSHISSLHYLRMITAYLSLKKLTMTAQFLLVPVDECQGTVKTYWCLRSCYGQVQTDQLV